MGCRFKREIPFFDFPFVPLSFSRVSIKFQAFLRFSPFFW